MRTNDTERLPPAKAMVALVIINILLWSAIAVVISATHWLWGWLTG